MLKIWLNADRLQKEALATLLIVFAVGFGIAFSVILRDFLSATPSVSLQQVVALTLAGYVYLEGTFRAAYYGDDLNRRQFTLVLFAMMLMVSIMQYLASDFFILWILALPLAGDVDNHYQSPPANLIIYASIIAAVIGPVAIINRWTASNIIFTGLSLGSGLIFVVVFSRLRRREKDVRLKAESLARELEAANHKLAEFATQADELATTRERNRIAREIHDNLGHYLTVVNVQLEASKLLIDKNPEKAREAVGKAQQMTQEGLQSVRQSIHALRVSAVENRPISEALADLCTNHQASGVVTDYKIIGEPRTLNEKVKLTLYRIVQEGLTNSRKYADATQVSVALSYDDPDTITLLVADDGVGADNTDSGFGLLGIRERIGLLGGTLKIETAPSEGFMLHASIPA